jgi:hypothetical protein
LRIFLDECVDWRLARDIVGHDVMSAQQMGWTGVRNGDLLVRVAAHFDVCLTVDRNLSFQQNLGAFDVAVVVIRSPSNRLADLRRLVPELLVAVDNAQRGAVTYVGS